MCTILSESLFCKGCLNQDKNDADKTIHNLQLTSAWIRSGKARVEHYIFLFSLF